MEPRADEYISGLRKYYARCFCRDVNGAEQLVGPSNAKIRARKNYPDWRQRLSDDPDFPVAEVAEAIKRATRGEEDDDVSEFVAGADVILRMDRKYRPRDTLLIAPVTRYDEKGKRLVPVASAGSDQSMVGFSFGLGLHVEGFGERPDPSQGDDYMRFLDSLDLLDADNGPLPFLDAAAVDKALRQFSRDPEYSMYMIHNAANPAWAAAQAKRQERRDLLPRRNTSLTLFLDFRRYLRQDRRFLQLGVCRHKDCGKLYVKAKGASGAQRYCPRHISYHRAAG